MASSEFIDPVKSDLDDQVVATNRVTKIVKGRRRTRSAALVVVGDRKGHVGFGTGKIQEVLEAIRKIQAAAEKNLIIVPIVGTTTPHEVIGVYGGGKTMLKPAVEGSRVAVGGAVRNVMDLAGAADVALRCLGSNTSVNVVRTTFEGLKQLENTEEVVKLRGVSVDRLAE